MKMNGMFRGALLLSVSALAASVWAGETIKIRRGLVVPVQFRENLSLRENRVGDRFEVRVEDDRDLPAGSRLLGSVLEIRPATEERGGYMDLDFDTLLLPDGSRQRVQAVPIRMDDAAIRKGGDGRFTAKKKLESSKKQVLGGMIGGYLLGKILNRKESELVMLGALAGVIMAEAERSGAASSEVVIRKEMAMGALFERDAQFEWDDARTASPNETDERESAGAQWTFEGRELRFAPELAPYREGETWMVPLRATAEQVGLKVDDENSRRIFVEDDEMVLILEHDSRICRLNGKKVELSRNVARREGAIYVPIDALLKAKTGRWTVNGTRIEK